MAVAGSLSSLSCLLTFATHQDRNVSPPWLLKIIHHVSLTEFVGGAQHVLDANKFPIFKYVVAMSIVLPHPISLTMLYAYALYVASLTSTFVFHAYYLAFHAAFQYMENSGMMASLCLFFLMKSVYELADIAMFIDEALLF